MPEYGVFPPELYVEVLNKEEISAIMAYAYKENIPVVCRGAGTGLAGGATCKYGGIMLSVMRMNKIFHAEDRGKPSPAHIVRLEGLPYHSEKGKNSYELQCHC